MPGAVLGATGENKWMRVSCPALSGLPVEPGVAWAVMIRAVRGWAQGGDSSYRTRIREETLSGMEFELKLKEWEKYDSLANGEPL